MAFFKKSVKDYLGELLGGAAMAQKGTERQLEELAVREAAVYTAVSFVAEILSGCEILAFEHDAPVRNGDWYVWNVSANPNQSSRQLVFEWIIDYYLKGRGLIVPLKEHLYIADDFSVNENAINGDTYEGVCVRSYKTSYQVNKKFKAKDVFFLSQGNKEIKRLLDCIFSSYDELLSNSRKSSKQGNGEKYVLNLEAYPSGTEKSKKEYFDEIRDNLVEFASKDAGAYVATKGQTLNRFTSSSTSGSSDYISIRKEIYSICATALHLPAGLLEGNTTASDQLLNQAITTAIDPLAEKMSAELTRKMYTQDQVVHKGCRMVVDTSAIKHVDAVDMADKLDKLVASGLMCIDEARRRCNMPELNTDWSQAHYLTLNYKDLAEIDPLERRDG